MSAEKRKNLSSRDLAEIIKFSEPGSFYSTEAISMLLKKQRILVDRLVDTVSKLSSEERKRHVDTLVTVLSSTDPNSELFLNALGELAMMAKGEDITG